MASDIALAMLKADLGLLTPPPAVATYMGQLLDAAEVQIRARGAALDAEKTADLQFVASWAAWLYRKRDTGAGLPEMLRYELSSRLIGKVTAGGDTDTEADA